MERILLIFLLVLNYSIIYSQKGKNFIKINGGAEITVGSFTEAYPTGYGIYITDYYGTTEKSHLVLSTGIAAWKSNEGSNVKAGFSLTTVGYRHFFVPKFYLQGDLGIAIGIRDWSGGQTRFTYGVGPGYLFKNSGGGGLDISARLNRAAFRTWVGLHFGYQFKL